MCGLPNDEISSQSALLANIPQDVADCHEHVLGEDASSELRELSIFVDVEQWRHGPLLRVNLVRQDFTLWEKCPLVLCGIEGALNRVVSALHQLGCLVTVLHRVIFVSAQRAPPVK